MVVFLYIYFLPIFALVGKLYQISIDIYLKSYYTHRLCYSLLAQKSSLLLQDNF